MCNFFLPSCLIIIWVNIALIPEVSGEVGAAWSLCRQNLLARDYDSLQNRYQICRNGWPGEICGHVHRPFGEESPAHTVTPLPVAY